MRSTTAVAVLCLIGMAAPAHAQIYSWRDERGTLVLSDRPRPDGREEATARRYALPGEDTETRARAAQPVNRTDFEELITEHARMNDVRPALVRAVVQVESAFNPSAVSPKGARGLMQLMPSTARQLGVMNPFDPVENVRAGVAYLRQLLDRYGNNETLALAAYNAGPGAVDRHRQTIPPYAETRRYVVRVNQLAGAAAEGAGTRIYRTVEVIDGREVVTYSDRRSPTRGTAGNPRGRP